MDSQTKLGELASDVRRIQVAQKELDTNLDTIFAYQMELKSTLEVRLANYEVSLAWEPDTISQFFMSLSAT